MIASSAAAQLQTPTDAELVYVRGIAPDATYRFKHALIRDAAYEALLKSRRKELHGEVDKKFPVLKEAHHAFKEAHIPARGISDPRRAANQPRAARSSRGRLSQGTYAGAQYGGEG